MLDEENIIKGTEALEPLPQGSLGAFIFDKLNNKEPEDSIINISTGEEIFFNTFFQQTCKIAFAFKKFGLKRNDVILVCSENSCHYFQPIIAAIYSGIIAAPLNYNHTTREILHAISISKPKIIFCSSKSAQAILNLKGEATYVKKIVSFDSDQEIEGTQSVNDFLDEYSEDNITINNEIVAKDINVVEQVALIMSSSGTTGLPKGVIITHQQIYAVLSQFRDTRFFLPPNGIYAFTFLPFFHVIGFYFTLDYILNYKKIVVMSKFEEKLFLETSQNYKVSTACWPPALVVMLANSSLVEQFNISHMEDVICGSAPLNKKMEELFKRKIKVSSFRQGYGMTEAPIVILVPLKASRSGSIGQLTPHMSGKILGHTGKALGPCENGELCLKGPLITKGYYKNEAATGAAIDEDGWLHTGDLGYYDEDNFFYIVDRIKELIKYKSFQVPPAELEGMLLTHPDISDAGVVGIPNEMAGELPLALIVKKSKTELTETEVMNFVAERVSHEKRLRGGVKFVKELPRNAVGKLSRPELRKVAQEMYTIIT